MKMKISHNPNYHIPLMVTCLALRYHLHFMELQTFNTIICARSRLAVGFALAMFAIVWWIAPLKTIGPKCTASVNTKLGVNQPWGDHFKNKITFVNIPHKKTISVVNYLG